jgi:hypothetical protein
MNTEAWRTPFGVPLKSTTGELCRRSQPRRFDPMNDQRRCNGDDDSLFAAYFSGNGALARAILAS